MSEDLDDTSIHVRAWRLACARADEALLAADELERVARMPRAAARSRFVAARAMLRRVLSAYVDVEPAALRFDYGAHGKPALAGHAGLAFNLSHCGDVALLAIADGMALGVDVERIDAAVRWEAIAQRFLGDRERRVLASTAAEQRLATFFRLWTVREAYLKARGVGLDAPTAAVPEMACGACERGSGGPAEPRETGMAAAPAWRCVELGELPGCAAAVVWNGPPRSIRFIDVAGSLLVPSGRGAG